MENKNMKFQEVDGLWRRVDSQEPNPPTLAEVLEQLHIVVDDCTQFCRIIRYTDDYKETIVYRVYGKLITIDIFYNE